MINESNWRFLNFSFNLLEQIHHMIPCYETHGSKQRINNKSIQEKYKIWILVEEAYGFVVQFRQVQKMRNSLPPVLNGD